MSIMEQVAEQVQKETFSPMDFLTAEKVISTGRKARIITAGTIGGLSTYLGWIYGVTTMGLNPPAAIAYGLFNGAIWASSTYGASMMMKEATILHRIRTFTETELQEELKKVMAESA
jgi:hypothetical protein